MKIPVRFCLMLVGIGFLPGCAMTDTEKTSLLGSVAATTAGAVGSAVGMGWVGQSAMGYGINAATAVAVHVVSKHEATKMQKEIAEARAKAVYAELPPATKKQVQKKRYIAVDTKKDSRITGEKAVMVFDTKTEKVVGNDVYDVEKAPPVGSTAKFDTVSATYVGS